MQGNYVEAECVDIDPANQIITCQYNKPFKGHDQAFTGRSFQIPYDMLVVAVSAYVQPCIKLAVIALPPFAIVIDTLCLQQYMR